MMGKTTLREFFEKEVICGGRDISPDSFIIQRNNNGVYVNIFTQSQWVIAEKVFKWATAFNIAPQGIKEPTPEEIECKRRWDAAR